MAGSKLQNTVNRRISCNMNVANIDTCSLTYLHTHRADPRGRIVQFFQMEKNEMSSFSV